MLIIKENRNCKSDLKKMRKIYKKYFYMNIDHILFSLYIIYNNNTR